MENDDRRLMDERKPARKEKSWTDRSEATWVASRARVAIRERLRWKSEQTAEALEPK